MESPTSIARVFDRALADDPAREALVTRSARLTYGELDALADRAAYALADLGVRPGDRVAASLPNEWEVVVAFHGAMRLGAVWVGVNRVLAAPERQYLIDDSGARLLLAETEVAATAARVTPLDVAGWRAALDAAPHTPWTGPAVDPFAPAGLAYTSGTTGRPKGVLLSHFNMFFNAYIGAEKILQTDRDEIGLAVLPLFH